MFVSYLYAKLYLGYIYMKVTPPERDFLYSCLVTLGPVLASSSLLLWLQVGIRDIIVYRYICILYSRLYPGYIYESHPSLMGVRCFLIYRQLNVKIWTAIADSTPDQVPLSWYLRMKIAYGTAKGLEYLHEKANPPVIYRDLKSPNILLDEKYNPKLSDFGLAKLGPVEGKTHISTRVMGTYGYCAPEYIRTGQLTVKTDVYSFGVFLLELITGRRAVDTSRPASEQILVNWVRTSILLLCIYTQLACLYRN